MAILDPFTVGLPVKFGLCTFTLFPKAAFHFGPRLVSVPFTFYHFIEIPSIPLPPLAPPADRAFRQLGLMRDSDKPLFFFLRQA
ncbi:hypothetical protein, partial [Harryflintia acetispora]|uniref:hypothetical protein n=1 Tax=Harryflintia acetispora TaxID=1849041 RepID=UPI001A9ACC59